MTSKADLRARMRALRKALAAEAPDAAAAAAAHAPAVLASLFPEEPDGRVAAVYAPIGSELDTAPLAEALVAAGMRLALPRVDELAAPMQFRAFSPGDPLEVDSAGCPAPLDLAEALAPALVFVPLLAFDAAGGRLGQGGGYYDRTIEALRRTQAPPRFVGFAYAGQQVERLPAEVHDQPLDGVLTEVAYMAAQRITE